MSIFLLFCLCSISILDFFVVGVSKVINWVWMFYTFSSLFSRIFFFKSQFILNVMKKLVWSYNFCFFLLIFFVENKPDDFLLFIYWFTRTFWINHINWTVVSLKNNSLVINSIAISHCIPKHTNVHKTRAVEQKQDDFIQENLVINELSFYPL